MAAPDFFIRSLLRVAKEQGREVLLAIVTSQFQQITTSGGKQLTGASANGKSFSYTVPSGLDVAALMAKAEEALTLFDSMSEDELTEMLTARPVSTTTAAHVGRCGYPRYHLGY